MWLAEVMLGLIIGYILLVIMGVLIYIMTSIALYSLASNNGHKDIAILSWVPIGNIWVMCKLIGTIVWDNKEVDSAVLIVIPIITQFLILAIRLRILSTLNLILVAVISVVLLYELLRRLRGIQSPLVLAVISTLIPLVFPFIIYKHKDELLMSVDKVDYRYIFGSDKGEQTGGQTGGQIKIHKDEEY